MKSMNLLNTMCWVSIVVISKDRKKHILLYRGLKDSDRYFKNIMNKIASIKLISFSLSGNNLKTVLVKAIKSGENIFQIFNALDELDLDLLISFENNTYKKCPHLYKYARNHHAKINFIG